MQSADDPVARWLSAMPAASGTPGGGVFVYLQQDSGGFRIVRLARESQALALALQDLDGDGRLDIHVGNDFALPDAVFLAAGDRWERAEPLAAMTRNTMSLDAGDIDNDGVDELFATDMKPYRPTRKEEDRWYFVVVGMEELPPYDPQVVRNVLLRRAGESYRDVAVPAGVDASGWSWSSRLGDLDQDGFLDIYVVNGMVSAELFGQLPAGELTERNLAFRNRGDGTFAEAREWALDDTAGGRSMTMADLDDDGDLDIAVNNLLSPAVVFENRLCGGASLQVALRRPGSGNRYALGARVSLVTSAVTYVRQMRSTAGYLSGEPPRLHFGLPAGARIDSLSRVQAGVGRGAGSRLPVAEDERLFGLLAGELQRHHAVKVRAYRDARGRGYEPARLTRGQEVGSRVAVHDPLPRFGEAIRVGHAGEQRQQPLRCRQTDRRRCRLAVHRPARRPHLAGSRRQPAHTRPHRDDRGSESLDGIFRKSLVP